VTDRPVPWTGVFNCLTDLADAKPNSAEYVTKVRKVYDVLIEDGCDPVEVRDGLLYCVSTQHQRGLISKQHRALIAELLPKPPRQKRGRPKGALGDNAYNKRHQLYLDWIYEKTVNPSLTKEQFAKNRLGITDEDLEGEYGSDHRPKVDALLQELKPARMKRLDEGQRRALETIYPLVITTSYKNLYREFCAAKEIDPALTEEQFVKNHLRITDEHLRTYPRASDLIRETMDYLEQGRKLSADSERG
jgi:hypothetical protein